MDVIRESARAGRVVFFEESARDGAQAKTLMSADFRVRLAREQGAVFGADGPRHVVFAAGFPSVCGQEFEATRRVALEAQGSVSPAAICRGTVSDARLALSAVRGAEHARVMVIVAASEATARALVHGDAHTALAGGLDVVKEAVGLADGIAVDVCLVDAPRADRALVAEYAAAMTAQGAGTVVLADTVGDLLPDQSRALFRQVALAAGPEAVLVSHLHNDLGLGLANTLAALETGVRVAACSWLGLAERSGMVATEQLLFLLAHDPAKAARVLGTGCTPWWTQPDLTRLPGIARMVSRETGVPLTVTTPVVGTGVATISTGTPFTHPQTFQPYDPQQHLGLAPSVVLTHLASRRVLRAVAERLGHDLDPLQTRTALAWVKDRAYQSGQAVVADADFAAYLDGLTAQQQPQAPEQPHAQEELQAPEQPHDQEQPHAQDQALTSAALDTDAAAAALTSGRAVVLPNPSPLTYVVAATGPRLVNEAKQRPAGQEVALWVHDEAVWTELSTTFDLAPGALATALALLRVELVTLLVPVRVDAVPPQWALPALRDGHLLLFGARWQPLAPLLEGFPRLYVSSANRTGQPPAATAALATAMFGPDIPVVDGDGLRDTAVPHAATTMLRIAHDGGLTHIRPGAQDRAHGPDPAAYLGYLRNAAQRLRAMPPHTPTSGESPNGFGSGRQS
ncbi:hypothetical protein [Catenulispora sp. MAP5-51]|uniref:hypothetical protein n=1 Tax=Catenulispora sp. MAP5-51 TaxID=3156298 RepID=UPI003517891B